MSGLNDSTAIVTPFAVTEGTSLEAEVLASPISALWEAHRRTLGGRLGKEVVVNALLDRVILLSENGLVREYVEE